MKNTKQISKFRIIMKYNCRNMTIPEIYTKTSLQKKYLANCKNSRKFHYIKLQNI